MRSLSGAGWSSQAARRAHNPKVVGSNPTPATNFKSIFTASSGFNVNVSSTDFLKISETYYLL